MAQLRFVILINKLFFCSAVVGMFAVVRAGYAAIRGGDREARVVGTTSSPSPLRQLSIFYFNFKTVF